MGTSHDKLAVSMETAKIIQSFIAVSAWPFVALVTLAVIAWNRKGILSLLPRTKVTLKIFNLTIETSIPVIEQSVGQSLGGRKLTAEQLSLLRKLRDEGRMKFDSAQAEAARPLRNCGLIKHYPEGGQLANATEIEITILGSLLVEAAGEH
jgi:hypothetical protein